METPRAVAVEPYGVVNILTSYTYGRLGKSVSVSSLLGFDGFHSSLSLTKGFEVFLPAFKHGRKTKSLQQRRFYKLSREEEKEVPTGDFPFLVGAVDQTWTSCRSGSGILPHTKRREKNISLPCLHTKHWVLVPRRAADNHDDRGNDGAAGGEGVLKQVWSRTSPLAVKTLWGKGQPMERDCNFSSLDPLKKRKWE